MQQSLVLEEVIHALLQRSESAMESHVTEKTRHYQRMLGYIRSKARPKHSFRATFNRQLSVLSPVVLKVFKGRDQFVQSLTIILSDLHFVHHSVLHAQKIPHCFLVTEKLEKQSRKKVSSRQDKRLAFTQYHRFLHSLMTLRYSLKTTNEKQPFF